MPQGNISQDATQIANNGNTGYATSASQIKYRTINNGSPLTHDTVDANFEIFRKAINGLVSDISAINVDIDGVVDKDVTSVMSGTTLSFSTNNSSRNYGIRKSGTNLYVNVPWVNTDTNTTYSAGNGISLSGTTFTVGAGGGLTQTSSGIAHADTSSRSSVNNSGRTYIQDITLDGYGHVTGINSKAETYTYSLPTASSSTLGGIKVGSGLSISGGVLSANVQSIPTASSSVLGGIKVGSGLTISNGVLSANATSSTNYSSTNTNFAIARPVYSAFNLSAGTTAISNLLELYHPTSGSEGGQIHLKFAGQNTPDGIEQHAHVIDTIYPGTVEYPGMAKYDKLFRIFSTYTGTYHKPDKVDGAIFFSSGDFDGKSVLSIPGQLYQRLNGFRITGLSSITYEGATYFQNLIQNIQKWPDGTDNTLGIYSATAGAASKTISYGGSNVYFIAANKLPKTKIQVLAYHPTISGFGGSKASDQHEIFSGFDRYTGGAISPSHPQDSTQGGFSDPKLEVTIAEYQRIVGAFPPFFYDVDLKMRQKAYPDSETTSYGTTYLHRNSIFSSTYRTTLGLPTARWGTIFTTKAVDISSDRRLKGEIQEIEEAERRVAIKAKSLIRRYKIKEETESRIIYILSDAQIQELTGDNSMKGGNYYFFQKPDEPTQAVSMVLSDGKWDGTGDPIELADFYREETVEEEGEIRKKVKDISEVITYLKQEGVQQNEEGIEVLGRKKHFGIIAQDLEQAFIDEGLDPDEYGVLKKHVYWVGINEKGKKDRSQVEVDGYKKIEERGVRYDELWALIIAAL